MTIPELNPLDRDAFAKELGFAFEHSPWVARKAWERRPFGTIDELHAQMLAVVQEARGEERIALIAAHPDLAGRVAREGGLTAESAREQKSAALDNLTQDEMELFDRLNNAYRERFGFPFVICAREHNKDSILEQLESRRRNDREAEIANAITEIAKIARLRLKERVRPR